MRQQYAVLPRLDSLLLGDYEQVAEKQHHFKKSVFNTQSGASAHTSSHWGYITKLPANFRENNECKTVSLLCLKACKQRDRALDARNSSLQELT